MLWMIVGLLAVLSLLELYREHEGTTKIRYLSSSQQDKKILHHVMQEYVPSRPQQQEPNNNIDSEDRISREPPKEEEVEFIHHDEELLDAEDADKVIVRADSDLATKIMELVDRVAKEQLKEEQIQLGSKAFQSYTAASSNVNSGDASVEAEAEGIVVEDVEISIAKEEKFEKVATEKMNEKLSMNSKEQKEYFIDRAIREAMDKYKLKNSNNFFKRIGDEWLNEHGDMPKKKRKKRIFKPTMIQQPWNLTGRIMPYHLPSRTASDFCSNKLLFPPVMFPDCDHTQKYYLIRPIGGYTAALKVVIMSALVALEEGRCFIVIPEHQTDTINVATRYTEPIGIPMFDSSKQRERDIYDGNYEILLWNDIWADVNNRRPAGTNHSIPIMGYNNIDGHHLKWLALMRLWRPLPKVRHQACHRLETYGLKQEYIAFSVRRGDKKSVENFDFASPMQYIQEAELVIPGMFHGVPPKIFVATGVCVRVCIRPSSKTTICFLRLHSLTLLCPFFQMQTTAAS